MYLLIDNYDSFTYNLADLFLRQSIPLTVMRNDAPQLDQLSIYYTHEKISEPIIFQNQPLKGIIISPGPGKPEDSGKCPQILKHLAGKIPVLGICLGHQLLAQISGARIQHGSKPMHGKVSDLYHHSQNVFEGIPSPVKIMRYHSLIVSNHNFPKELHITGTTSEGEIMALEHSQWRATIGLQFHPESILSQFGEKMINNWYLMTQI